MTYVMVFLIGTVNCHLASVKTENFQRKMHDGDTK